MASLNIYTVTFTRKQVALSKHRAQVFATNELEARHLLSKKFRDLWVMLDVEHRADRGFLTQGKRYNPKARIEQVLTLH